MAILGSCCRVARPTPSKEPWHTSQPIFQVRTWTSWLKIRFAAGNTTFAGSLCTVLSKPTWQVSQADGGSTFSPFFAASMSWQSSHSAWPGRSLSVTFWLRLAGK